MALSNVRLRTQRTVLTVLTLGTTTAFLTSLLLLPPHVEVADRNAWRLMFALALLVSVAGVFNTLLMSVTQRSREIGTLKCLGARNAFIFLSVVAEAALLGVAGAAVGVVAGTGIAVLIGVIEHGASVFQHLAFHGLPGKIAFVIGLGLGLAMLGAAIPALLSARLAPMDALRAEK